MCALDSKCELIERATLKKTIYNGQAVGFNADLIMLPNGKPAVREYMTHPGAAAVMPILPNGDIIFVKQYRYPIAQVTLEIPAGKLKDKADNPLARAKAELKEETGYTASQYEKLLSIWTSPAFSTEIIHIYLARGLEAGKSKPDEDEFLNISILPFQKAWQLLSKGEIKDIKTIIALQAWKVRILEGK